jgi:hypothetical protein
MRNVLAEGVDKIGAFIHHSFDTRSQMVGQQALGPRYDEVNELMPINGFFYVSDGPERGEYAGFPEEARTLDDTVTHILVAQGGGDVLEFLETARAGRDLIEKYEQMQPGAIFAVSYNGLWENFCKVTPENKSWPLKIEWACDPNFSDQRDYANNVAAALRETVSVPPGGAALAKPGPGES